MICLFCGNVVTWRHSEENPFTPIKFMVTDDIFIAARDIGRGVYVIERHPFGMVLNKNLDWEVEPQPSSRSEEFKERTRFTLEESIKLAQKILKKIKC
jgi:hypothetical protein